MSETAVRVDLRQAVLSESATLREDEDQVFLVLDNPPPVRSLLRISVGEDQRVFEVGRVIEVVDEGEPKRGCYGQFVELERLVEQEKVGSEHLEPGISSSGVPAPVVIMNTADMMLGDVGGDEAEAVAAAAAAAEAAVDAAEAAAAAQAGDAEAGQDDDAEAGQDDDAGDDAKDAEGEASGSEGDDADDD